MALQSSGAISLANIAAEFGDAQPHSLSEFYRGGGKVPNATPNNNVPTSGAIALGNFYNATNRIPINITLSANQTNYVLNTAKASGYVAGISDITLTINSGVYVSSNSTAGRALDVDTSWASGDTITIVNNGFIVGMGGAGGKGSSNVAGTDGSAGSLALRAQRAVTINNAGTIAGGGGGGGGGASRFSTTCDKIGCYNSYYGGGGGGGGRSSAAANSAAGAGGASSGVTGQPGTVSAPGNGGAGYPSIGGAGGTGGAWGASGAAGSAGNTGVSLSFAARAGGSGGAAVSGNSNITWAATGTRLGAIA